MLNLQTHASGSLQSSDVSLVEVRTLLSLNIQPWQVTHAKMRNMPLRLQQTGLVTIKFKIQCF